ncbi:hypothetical protein J6590_016877 [Homalodisca vitripennis]|nr:hypothetical protein J6590_016877 [Homalodisca vitripennis]
MITLQQILSQSLACSSTPPTVAEDMRQVPLPLVELSPVGSALPKYDEEQTARPFCVGSKMFRFMFPLLFHFYMYVRLLRKQRLPFLNSHRRSTRPADPIKSAAVTTTTCHGNVNGAEARGTHRPRLRDARAIVSCTARALWALLQLGSLGLQQPTSLLLRQISLSTAQPHYLISYLVTEPIGREEIGDPYQDEERQAAILLHKDPADSSLLLEGTIGDELIVKPVPASVRQHLDTNHPSLSRDDDDEAFLDEEAGEDEAVREGFPLQPKHHHIVYRRSISHTIDQELSDYAFMEPDEMPQKHRSKRSATISKREAPYVIYPEILVIVDYDGYRLHGGNNVQIKRYFVSFWNGVDMRYKLLKGPKIRISIAGIIISRGRDATPYLERNRVGRDAIDSAAALTDMGKYLFRERRLPVYDIAVAVTKYDMCRRRKAGRCTKGTAGTSACVQTIMIMYMYIVCSLVL